MGVVLVMNAGSTGVKLRLVDADEAVDAIDSADEAPPGLEAVGHRIVHGGERFRAPLPLDDEAVEALGGLHISVNTAGGGGAQRTMTKEGPHDLDLFRRTIDLNLISSFNISR